jgi:hypothetical protein
VARGFSFSSIKRSLFRPLGTGAGCPAAIFIARPSSSGTSPNVFKIVASPKFPMFGSPRQRFQIMSTRTKSSRLSHFAQQKYFLFGGLGWHMMEGIGSGHKRRGRSSGRRACWLNNPVRVDHRFAHPYEPVTESHRAHASRRHARLRAAGRVRPPAFPAPARAAAAHSCMRRSRCALLNASITRRAGWSFSGEFDGGDRQWTTTWSFPPIAEGIPQPDRP